MDYNVSNLDGAVVALGNQHETAVTEFTFDASEWGDLSLLLTVQETTGDPYAASGQTQADGILHWTVGNDVTATAGDKTIVIRGLSDGVEKRSALFRGLVRPSHAEPGDAPEPTASWISELTIAEAERRDAETARGTAETERGEAEIQRDTAEQGRVSAEQNRAQAETGRGTAEQGRVSAEQVRVSAEQNRAQAETGRGTAEQGRVSAEQVRVSAEQGRVSAEQGRVSTEQNRAQAEQAREQSANQAISAANTAAANADAKATAADTAASAANTAAANANTAAAAANALPRTLGYAPYASGKIYTVSFNAPAISMASAGTRENAAVGLVASPSTDLVRATNDFEKIPIFRSVDANGYVDASGEFVITAFEREPAFKRDGSNGDVWCLFPPCYFKIEIGASTEKYHVSDMAPAGESGWFPSPGLVRQNGTIKPFLPIAKYRASVGSDGKYASISGKAPAYNISHNSQLTSFRSKGAQYCGWTTKDQFHLHMLSMIAFGTTHYQSVSAGDTGRDNQYPAAITETGVKRIIVTNAQAASFAVGDCVSIGQEYMSGTTVSKDRGNATVHNKADRVLITSVDALGDGINTAITVNVAATFDTTQIIQNVSGTDYTLNTIISTMPRYTGYTDSVLGQTGSPVSNTDSRHDCKMFGVENPFGSQYTILADVIKQYPNMYICDDCTKFSTAVTADYVALAYTLSAHSGWAYITSLGFDTAHPSARFGAVCTATSSTRFADGQYEDQVAGAREVLLGGHLYGGPSAGPVCAFLASALSIAPWTYGARLSATGRCGSVSAAA